MRVFLARVFFAMVNSLASNVITAQKAFSIEHNLVSIIFDV
jgi:hypothetical protein